MKELIKELIINEINKWTDNDIYAISLFVYDDSDNPCKPTVTLGYNTETQVAIEVANTDENEARWNYAYWIQNGFLCFGKYETAKLVKQWILDSDFPYYEDDDAAWSDDSTYDAVDGITQAFIKLLIEVVKDIHTQEILTTKFGKELPILIHELEYYDEIANQNIEANGIELVNDFSEWCRM